MTRKPNRAARVLALLESRYPGWVPAIEFEAVGGRQAWRTAIAEARAIVQLDGHTIENRTRQVLMVQKSSFPMERWTLSEYRLKKRSETETPAPVETQGHDCNAPVEGRLL